MTTTQSSSCANNGQSLWLSAGIFVIVALASQVLQNIQQRQRQDDDDTRNDGRHNNTHDVATSSSSVLGHGYSMKRMSIASIDNNNVCEDAWEEDYDDDDDDDDLTLQTRNYNQRRRRRQSVAAAKDSLENDVNEFQPKNSNWNHFEIIPVPSLSSQDDNDDDDHKVQTKKEEDDDDESSSSTSSSSSEEEFLWTSSVRKNIHHHHHHRRSVRSNNSLTRSSQTTTNHDDDGNNDNKRQQQQQWWDSKAARLFRQGLVGSFRSGAGDDNDKQKESSLGPIVKDMDTTILDNNDEDWRRVTSNQRNNNQLQLPMRRQSSAPTPGVSTVGLLRQSYNPQDHNRATRRRYNAQIMPNKVVMIRHGQSMGNINESLYSTTPDNAMPLTKLGWEEARHAGQVLKDRVLPKGETVHFIVSPYVRTVETFHGVVSAWCDPSDFAYIPDRDKRLRAWYGRLLELGLTWHEDPRIREQDFGNYQDPESIKKFKKERNRFGSFFYRFPHGESASDVFDRVSTFLDSLWRSFYLNRSRNYVLITHGISIRVLLARYFRYTIEQFQMLANPKNCDLVVLQHDGAGRLELEGRYEQTVTEGEDGEMHVVGSTFHERLRVVPPEFCPKAKIRISYDD